MMSSLLLLLFACDPSTKDTAPAGDSGAGGTDDTGTTDSDTTDDTGTAVDADGDGAPAGEDCDDSDPAVNPGATEVCGGGDEDCDGLTDDADDSVTGTSTFYADADGDGYGGAAVEACAAGPGIVEDSSDWDDGDASVWLAPDTWIGYLSSEFTDFCTGYGERRLEGGVQLDIATQADVDSLTCLTEISGGLSLSNNAVLTNLDGLANLTSITGSLQINYTTALTDVDGLSSLSSVTGQIFIFENSALTNLDGLASLSYVGASVSVTDNRALTSVDGLANLSVFAGPLALQGNSALCQGDVDAVTDALVDAGYTGRFYISDNNVTCDWDGDGYAYASDPDDGDASVWLAPDSYVGDLSSNFTDFCTGYAGRRLEGSLDLSAATQADVDSLTCLTEVSGIVLISSPALTDVDGLARLSSVGGDLYVYNNFALADVDGLASLTTVNANLYIEYNSALANLDGLANLSYVDGFVYITNNTVLTSVDGLANLSFVGAALSIYDNYALCQSGVDAIADRLLTTGYVGAVVTGLRNDITCDGDGDGYVYFSDPDDGDASVWLAPDSYVGDLSSNFTDFCTGYAGRRLEGNLNLSAATQADVDSLACLTEVTGSLTGANNAALTDVDGLASLTSVGGGLTLISNTALTNLDGFASLSSIGGGLWLENNDALTDITGLSGLSTVGGALYIYYNNALCQGDIDALVDVLVSAGYAGSVTSSNNNSGC